MPAAGAPAAAAAPAAGGATTPPAASAAGAAVEPSCASRFGAALLFALLLPFRLVWNSIVIFCLPCLGSYAQSCAWTCCCGLCLACGWRFKARGRARWPDGHVARRMRCAALGRLRRERANAAATAVHTT
jgi:hypothetical protein